ncbi:MAG: phenylacetate-CoA oxygenase subunit PaaI [Ardenticatenaceae bacterium]|nr:phenylacetate-CoA oxygenase subunit PaaI [Ardenticatenaceae bacterium]HBY92729.1 phenylacetic acid catabolic [Chloroflexota bacterium]
MAATTEGLQQRLDNKQLVELPDHMTEDYKENLKRTLIVSADTELVSAPSYYLAAQKAPSINSFISAMAIIQDELGHAHIAYRLLEDLGVSREELMYRREPRKFKYPYAFDVALESWAELVVANAFYDRAGFILLGDIYRHTSYGPWKRALVKVDREENFHLRHGESWMRRLVQSAEGREQVQRAVDWMFLLTVEWFGLPDDLKLHTGQLSYGLKGYTNDQLRQQWLSQAVPFCTEIGIKVPSHYDEQQKKWIVDRAFPSAFDPVEKCWSDKQISWDEVLIRWKARGPMNETFVNLLQEGHKELERLLARAA